MPYYALLYELVDDYIKRRAAFRQEHLRLAQEASERGDLLLGGAFADPPDKALLIFRAEDAGVVDDFVRKDPYVINGLVKSWKVRPWTVVIGKA